MMQTFSVPEIIISVPFVKAWAEATHDKKTPIILEEIIKSLKKGKSSHFEDIDSMSDNLYEHIQSFIYYKRSNEIPESKEGLNPEQIFEITVVNLMAYLMNVYRVLQRFDKSPFILDLDDNLKYTMEIRTTTHLIKYQGIIANCPKEAFKFF